MNHSWYVIHYFIIALITFCGLSYFTAKYDKKHGNNTSEDGEFFVFIIISIIWPIATIIAFVVGVIFGTTYIFKSLYKKLKLAGAK